MCGFNYFIKKVTKSLNISKSGYRMITNIGSDGGQGFSLTFHIIGGEKVGRLVRDKKTIYKFI